MRQHLKVWRRLAPAVVAGAAALVLSSAPARAVGLFDIHLEYGPGLLNDQPALAAFERAAQDWESRISSPIRVNVRVDVERMKDFDGNDDFNTIGSTGFAGSEFNFAYADVRNRMAARSVRPGNAVLASLPTAEQITANIPPGRAFQSTTVGVVRANQKALGIIPSDDQLDGFITFNSNFSFAYTRAQLNFSNVDFQTAATHELGHVLGFLSDVDEYDVGFTATNLTTLDLFRFNANAVPTTAEQFATYAREMRPGQPAVTSDLTDAYAMSTGFNDGDGNQASHWQDDVGFPPGGGIEFRPLIGVMDPTLNNGTYEDITAADLRAFELIGYDTVPEPGTAGVFVIVIGGLLLRRRRATAQQC